MHNGSGQITKKGYTMLVEVFSVMDVKIGAYAQPFFSQTIASGVRAFHDATLDKNTVLGSHPADFQLFHLGQFDDNTGIFVSQNPALIATALQEQS